MKSPDSQTVALLFEELERQGRSRASLGRLLGLDGAQVFRIASGRRRLRLDEWQKAQAWLGLAGAPVAEASPKSWRSRSDSELAVNLAFHAGRAADPDVASLLREAAERLIQADRVRTKVEQLMRFPDAAGYSAPSAPDAVAGLATTTLGEVFAASLKGWEDEAAASEPVA